MRPKLVPLCNYQLAKSAATKGIRLNGRGINEFRNFQVSFGKSTGSCEVIMEPGTRVLSQASATVGEPFDSRPGEGVLTISVWISPSATGEMAGSGAVKPALVSRTIEKMFKEHRAVDLASLCIKFGEKVWILRVDIHILDMNGCIHEAAAMAVLGSLMTFQRAQAYVDSNTNELVMLPLEESTPVKLHFFHYPALTSFVLTPCGKFISEPDEDEEEIFPGKLSIGINDCKELCYLNLNNPVDQALITEAVQTAQTKCLERIDFMKNLVAENDKERSIPVYQRKNEPRKTGKVFKLSDLKDLDVDNSEEFKNLSLLDEVSKPQVVNAPSEIVVKLKKSERLY